MAKEGDPATASLPSLGNTMYSTDVCARVHHGLFLVLKLSGEGVLVGESQCGTSRGAHHLL